LAIHCDDRFVIIKIGKYLVINVYLPCRDSFDRLLLCEDLLADIW